MPPTSRMPAVCKISADGNIELALYPPGKNTLSKDDTENSEEVHFGNLGTVFQGLCERLKCVGQNVRFRLHLQPNKAYGTEIPGGTQRPDAAFLAVEGSPGDSEDLERVPWTRVGVCAELKMSKNPEFIYKVWVESGRIQRILTIGVTEQHPDAL